MFVRVPTLAILFATALVAPALAQSTNSGAASIAKPTVVVQPQMQDQQLSISLRDAFTQALVSSGRFEVVDRAHLQQVLNEQNTSSSGQVLAGTEAALGRMVGANYMLLVKISKMDAVMDKRGGLFAMNMYAKATVDSNVQVLEVRSGRIIQSIDDEQIADGPPVAVTNATEAQSSQLATQYLRELQPKLLAQTSESVVAKLDSSKLADSGAAAQVQGRILDASGQQIIISLGAGSGIEKGMTLGVYTTKQLRNSDTGKMITTYLESGVIVVTQVDKEYSVVKRVSGHIANGEIVRPEQ